MLGCWVVGELGSWHIGVLGRACPIRQFANHPTPQLHFRVFLKALIRRCSKPRDSIKAANFSWGRKPTFSEMINCVSSSKAEPSAISKPLESSLSDPLQPFCNIGWYRNRCTCHLTYQPVFFFGRKLLRHLIYFSSELDSCRPNFQFSKISHSRFLVFGELAYWVAPNTPTRQHANYPTSPSGR